MPSPCCAPSAAQKKVSAPTALIGGFKWQRQKRHPASGGIASSTHQPNNDTGKIDDERLGGIMSRTFSISTVLLLYVFSPSLCSLIELSSECQDLSLTRLHRRRQWRELRRANRNRRSGRSRRGAHHPLGWLHHVLLLSLFHVEIVTHMCNQAGNEGPRRSSKRTLYNSTTRTSPKAATTTITRRTHRIRAQATSPSRRTSNRHRTRTTDPARTATIRSTALAIALTLLRQARRPTTATNRTLPRPTDRHRRTLRAAQRFDQLKLMLQKEPVI